MPERKSSRRSSVKPPAVAREAVLSRPIGFAFGVTGPFGEQLDGDERRRRERMPSAVCHLEKVRRLRGCCTWVQARSRQGDARARHRACWCAEGLYMSNRDPDQTDDFLDVPLTMAT